MPAPTNHANDKHIPVHTPTCRLVSEDGERNLWDEILDEQLSKCPPVQPRPVAASSAKAPPSPSPSPSPPPPSSISRPTVSLKKTHDTEDNGGCPVSNVPARHDVIAGAYGHDNRTEEREEGWEGAEEQGQEKGVNDGTDGDKKQEEEEEEEEAEVETEMEKENDTDKKEEEKEDVSPADDETPSSSSGLFPDDPSVELVGDAALRQQQADVGAMARRYAFLLEEACLTMQDVSQGGDAGDPVASAVLRALVAARSARAAVAEAAGLLERPGAPSPDDTIAWREGEELSAPTSSWISPPDTAPSLGRRDPRAVGQDPGGCSCEGPSISGLGGGLGLSSEPGRAFAPLEPLSPRDLSGGGATERMFHGGEPGGGGSWGGADEAALDSGQECKEGAGEDEDSGA